MGRRRGSRTRLDVVERARLLGGVFQAVTTTGYNTVGDQTTVTTPKDHVTTMAYAPAHRLTSVTDPESRVTRQGTAQGPTRHRRQLRRQPHPRHHLLDHPNSTNCPYRHHLHRPMDLRPPRPPHPTQRSRDGLARARRMPISEPVGDLEVGVGFAAQPGRHGVMLGGGHARHVAPGRAARSCAVVRRCRASLERRTPGSTRSLVTELATRPARTPRYEPGRIPEAGTPRNSS